MRMPFLPMYARFSPTRPVESATVVAYRSASVQALTHPIGEVVPSASWQLNSRVPTASLLSRSGVPGLNLDTKAVTDIPRFRFLKSIIRDDGLDTLTMALTL